MDEITKRYEQLVTENNRLRAENDRLAENQMQHCRGCRWAKPHDCGAFVFCERHDCVISLDTDGCSWRKPK